MNTDIYFKKNEVVDLTKCCFLLCQSNTGGKMLKGVFPSEMLKTDTMFSYEDVKAMNCIFYIKNKTKRWDSFKTFKGFINRLNKDIKN